MKIIQTSVRYVVEDDNGEFIYMFDAETYNGKTCTTLIGYRAEDYRNNLFSGTQRTIFTTDKFIDFDSNDPAGMIERLKQISILG